MIPISSIFTKWEGHLTVQIYAGNKFRLVTNRWFQNLGSFTRWDSIEILNFFSRVCFGFGGSLRRSETLSFKVFQTSSDWRRYTSKINPSNSKLYLKSLAIATMETYVTNSRRAVNVPSSSPCFPNLLDLQFRKYWMLGVPNIRDREIAFEAEPAIPKMMFATMERPPTDIPDWLLYLAMSNVRFTTI